MGIYDETVSLHEDHKLTDSWIKVWIMYMSELWRQKWIKFAMHSDFFAAVVIEHNGNQSWLCVWAYVAAQTCPKK